MAIDEIADLPIEKLAGSRCLLWLWATVHFRRNAEDLAESWGFTLTPEIVWNKGRLGMGNNARVQHEYLIPASRGGQRTLTRNLPTCINEPRGKHSAKPDRFRRIVEENSPGPWLELFGRKRVPGWTVFGNEDQTPSTPEQLPTG